MTGFSKNVYFDVLDNIVKKYNNTIHITFKMKPIDVRSDSCAKCNEYTNEKGPKFKVGDHVRRPNTKPVLLKDVLQNGRKHFFVISKNKNTVLWTYTIAGLNGKEIVGSFYGNELQKTNQKEFRIEKVIKRKIDKLFAKWKGYDNSFSSWIDKNNIE